MKILFVQDGLGAGGAERSNAELWYYILKKTDIKIKVAVLYHRPHGVEKEVLRAGIDVYFIKTNNLWGQIREIASLIKEFQPSLVHSTLFRTNLRVRLAKTLVRFYHIESLVNCPYNEYRLRNPNVKAKTLNIYRKIDKYTQKFGVDHFHANGETVSQHYQEKLGVPKEKLTIINRGRKENPFIEKSIHKDVETLRREINPDNKIQLINVARHESQKSQLTILKAINKIRGHQEGFLLLIAGRDGESTQELKKYITDKNLENFVKFLGFRKDVYRLLATSDIFVFPSRFEGLPGALIEAEASGLPIVCSDIDNNLEVVENLKNALIFPVDNSEALSKQLVVLINDKELREKMGKESLRIFSQRFQIEKINKKMIDFYRDRTVKMKK